MDEVSQELLLGVCATLAAGVMAPVASATSPIQAYKTADAQWTRTFEWTIEKSVSPDSSDLETGRSGTSTYTVEVTKSAANTATIRESGQSDDATVTSRARHRRSPAARSRRATGRPTTLSKALRAQAISTAGTLADYNQGDIGPGHCAD
jgi:VCBS repeat-containing protein